MSPKKRRHSVAACGASPESPPAQVAKAPGDPINYHSSLGGTLSLVSARLNQYFDHLELSIHREFFPAETADAQQGLAAMRRGFRSRLWRNHSLVRSEGNPEPATWDSERRRIIIQPELLEAASTGPLKQIASQSAREKRLQGFLLSVCMVERAHTRVVYTPLVGGWTAASRDENFQDREVKGLFSWRALPPLVQQELQLAFLMRMLIDAMWWKVPGGDPSGDSNRFVSIPLDDLVLCPIESVDLLDQMDSMSQHFDTEERPARHSVVKCKCVQYKDSLNTHLLIPSNRLRNHLIELSSAKQRSTADPIFKSVFNGVPSIRVSQALQITRDRLRAILQAQMAQVIHSPKRKDYESSDEES
eukprot:Gregarina_sp_Pseudo_9__2287@NODE_260_length_3370_cov_67_237766_g243_i0_p2_GENE_NODE_260_length_3370_cov_67_237766_g243_i0NODE_260_length_3370_cov_67_237766_g243_i0_p2_ORF_typecomplete_len360_score119_63_NODE_260_length_3370_cov_67_237766_g243_i017802859